LLAMCRQSAGTSHAPKGRSHAPAFFVCAASGAAIIAPHERARRRPPTR
jgi:hypothetical protein